MKTAAHVDLLSKPAYKKFFDEFAKRFEIIGSLSLPEQRKKGLELTKAGISSVENVYKIENIHAIGLDHHKIPVRLYYPNDKKDSPVFVYFHGGGWVYGGIEDSDHVARKIANHFNCIVASVDYRLAPEHPFPIPLEDCYAATKWVADHLKPQQFCVCGESAGGNLAAAVALMARDKKGPSISAQVLLYPVISSAMPRAVFEKCPDQYFVTWDFMNFFWTSYIQTPGQEKHPFASLDHAKDLSNLPPAVIVTAEYDPLRDEALHYANMLKKAGNTVIERTIPEALHGCFYINLFDEAKKGKLFNDIQKDLEDLKKGRA